MMIEPGTTIRLTYPNCNLVDSLANLRRRNVHVVGIRDLLAEPLTPAEFLRRPFVRRSRWLVRGYDCDVGEFRQFYLGCSAEYAAPSCLRVAMYEPGSKRPSYPISRPFGASRRERAMLATAIAAWSRRSIDDLRLCVYCDDLRIIRFAG